MNGIHRRSIAAVLASIFLLSCDQQGSSSSTTAADANAPALPDVSALPLDSAVMTSVREAARLAEATPPSTDAAGRLGMLLHAHEQHEPAIACYQRARALAPDAKGVRWLYYQGVVRESMKDEAAAASLFDQVLAAQPRHSMAQLRRAMIHSRQRNWPESFRLANQALASQPENPYVYVLIGEALVEQGQLDRAQQPLGNAILFSGEKGKPGRWPRAHELMARTLEGMNQKAQAANHRSVAQRFPDAAPPFKDAMMDAVAELAASPSAATSALKP